MGDFAKSIKASCNKILAEVDQANYEIFYDVATNTVEGTPVLTGLLKNQWYAKQGDDPSNELGTNVSIAGLDSLSSISNLYNVKEFYRKDGAMTLTNNVSYVYLAEKLGWEKPQWSGNVGPYAMVEQAVIATIGKYSG